MDIENLSKTDLILTAVFLSFVTAIFTGIVLIFLMEDTPEDIIRDRIIFTESDATSDDVGTTTAAETSDSDTLPESSTPSRDEILDTAVRAVARITADGTSPQAGVLVELRGQEVILTAAADYPATAQALFEDGTVADLESGTVISGFSRFSVTAAGDRIYPLSAAGSIPDTGESAFVVPLSAQPEILRVSITSVADNFIETSAMVLPATSLLLDDVGRLIGLYQEDQGSFSYIGQIERDL